MKDRDIVSNILKINPLPKFDFDGDDCVKAVFTDSSHDFYGVLRLMSSCAKKEILGLLSRLEKIRYLDLRKNRLGIFDLGLRSLNHLDLGSNYMSFIPDWIGKNNLSYLNLGVNELSCLPMWFENLISLRTLKLHKNKISDFSLLSSFSNLEEINLYFNCVNDIPDFLFGFERIKSFSWGISSLSILPDSISSWRDLEYLSLVGNELVYLPESICSCLSLVGMRLNKNKIKSLPCDIGNLKNLKDISLYKNNLSELPISFGLLELERCNLAENNFVVLPRVNSKWLALHENDLDFEWKK